ncbi:MAG: triose-phosphate isomerase [Chlamydiota bacterium]
MKNSIVIANWKMYKTPSETISFIQELAPLVDKSSAEIFLAVPFTSIAAAYEAAKDTNILIGAQNMNDATEGAFTGEIAAVMLKEAGAEFVLLGHSERRTLFHETDPLINRKVKKALEDDLIPVLCVGESSKERDEGKTEEVLQRQLEADLSTVTEEEASKMIIAYEPIWAIGTGKTATPAMAAKAHGFIRKCLSKIFGKKIADKFPILYGGSVKPDNIASLMQEEEINGVLVGGASLQVKPFSDIIQSC